MRAGAVQPTVEVVVLNWNGRAYLPGCLEALRLQDYPPTTITVVDNGSTDDSVAWLRRSEPNVNLVAAGANVGFAAGNNIALRQTTAGIVALLNPDVVVSADWLARLVAAFAEDERIGVVGSKLWYPDGRTIQHGGGYLRPPQAMPGHAALGEADIGQVDTPRDVAYVIGGAMAIRAETLRDVGLLDEGYFLYYEDVDYCARVRRGGRRVVYAPDATAVHVESATAVKGSFSYLGRFHTGRWRYLLKHEDAQLITSETLPAEAAWLATIDLDERLAAALAYETTLAAWPELLAARAREGAGPLHDDTAAAIRTGLLNLRDEAVALPGPPATPDYLTGQSLITAPAFESSIPLVAALRAAWTAIAARDYLAPLLAQQNAVNEILAAATTERRLAVESSFVRLRELHAAHAALSEETRLLALQVREAQRVLAELEAQAQPRVTSAH